MIPTRGATTAVGHPRVVDEVPDLVRRGGVSARSRGGPVSKMPTAHCGHRDRIDSGYFLQAWRSFLRMQHRGASRALVDSCPLVRNAAPFCVRPGFGNTEACRIAAAHGGPGQTMPPRPGGRAVCIGFLCVGGARLIGMTQLGCVEEP